MNFVTVVWQHLSATCKLAKSSALWQSMNPLKFNPNHVNKCRTCRINYACVAATNLRFVVVISRRKIKHKSVNELQIYATNRGAPKRT